MRMGFDWTRRPVARRCPCVAPITAAILGLCLLGGPAAAKPASVAGGTVHLRADFGGLGDGVADDTKAVFAFLEACAHALCAVEPGRYRVTAPPPKLDYAVSLVGAGMDVSEFIRDYDGEKGRGFLHFEGVKASSGSHLAGFSIASAPGRRGGHALAGFSTPTASLANMRIEHVKFSSYGENSWDSTILIDGLSKTTGAKGVRALHFDGCLVFGADGYSMDLKGVMDFRFDGGVYAAGGSNPLSGGIRMTGTKEVPSFGVLLIGNTFGYLNLSHVTTMKVIAAAGIAGSWIDGVQRAIDADDTVDRVQIIGEPFGAVTTKWTNSSILLPDGTIQR